MEPWPRRSAMLDAPLPPGLLWRGWSRAPGVPRCSTLLSPQDSSGVDGAVPPAFRVCSTHLKADVFDASDATWMEPELVDFEEMRMKQLATLVDEFLLGKKRWIFSGARKKRVERARVQLGCERMLAASCPSEEEVASSGEVGGEREEGDLSFCGGETRSNFSSSRRGGEEEGELLGAGASAPTKATSSQKTSLSSEQKNDEIMNPAAREVEDVLAIEPDGFSPLALDPLKRMPVILCGDLNSDDLSKTGSRCRRYLEAIGLETIEELLSWTHCAGYSDVFSSSLNVGPGSLVFEKQMRSAFREPESGWAADRYRESVRAGKLSGKEARRSRVPKVSPNLQKALLNTAREPDRNVSGTKKAKGVHSSAGKHSRPAGEGSSWVGAEGECYVGGGAGGAVLAMEGQDALRAAFFRNKWADSETADHGAASRPLGSDSGGSSRSAATDAPAKNLDYIFFSRNRVKPVRVLLPFDSALLGPERLPNRDFPSDHIPLVVDLEVF